MGVKEIKKDGLSDVNRMCGLTVWSLKSLFVFVCHVMLGLGFGESLRNVLNLKMTEKRLFFPQKRDT